MQPHQKEFNVVDLFEIVVDYCMKQSSEINILIPDHMRKRSPSEIELEI